MSTSAGNPIEPSLDVTGSARAVASSSFEPSPASTYGASISSQASDDVPQTPNEGAFLKKISKLTIRVGKDENKIADVERYSPPFVRHDSQGRVDDPFTSPIAHHGSGQRTPTGPKFMDRDRASKSDNWRTGSNSSLSSTSESTSPTVDKVARDLQSGRGVFVREYAPKAVDIAVGANDSAAIKAEDAQAYYPPSSCVFVANLLQSESDEALEVAVTQVFREFGVVFVKIRRDAKHMPFAFCQYTNDSDATRAIKEGRGRTIKGRPCRCEKAKAHRLFFIERKWGDAISTETVEQLLRGYGTISYCRPVSPIERATHNLGEGIIVQFELYDEGQAALQAYRNDDEYKMQSLANMGMSSPSRGRVPEDPAGRHYLDEYDLERRSIYIGNLPTDAVNDDIRDLFMRFGTTLKVTLHKNESIIDATQQRCFGFVEFESQPTVAMVLHEQQTNGFTLRGMVLRVSQKDTTAANARSQRRRTGHTAQVSASPYHSPVSQSMGQQHMSQIPQLSPYQSQFPSTGYPSPLYYNAYGSSAYNSQPSYYSSQYSPYAYYVPSSPTYPTGLGSTPTYSPMAQSYYQAFPGMPAYAFSPSAMQATFAPMVSPSAVSHDGVQGPDERSGTPTPAGHDTGFESLDAQ